MPGTVMLYHGVECIRSLSFRDEWHKKRIIDQWKRLYAKGFDKTKVVSVYDGEDFEKSNDENKSNS